MTAPPEFDHQVNVFSARDSAATTDQLDRRRIAGFLAVKLLETREAVVGVFGTWGSGKSFVLDLAINELFHTSSAVRPIVCYFQPWRFEPDISLAPGLIMALQSVELQFPGLNPRFDPGRLKQVRELGDSLWRLMRRAVSWLKPVAQGAAAGLGAIPPGVFPAKDITAAVAGAVGALPDFTVDEPSTWDPARIRSKMTDLIAGLRDAAARAEQRRIEDYRVVVVIDDLDRCGPDLMVDMLNWLKIHLSVEGCSFLLALDHEAAARAIVGRYREYLGETADMAYGLRYLEKIVDFEVELGRSELVERMAAQALGEGTDRVEELIERVLDRQGVRSREINQLMRLPTLQSPRTMLKIVNRFHEVLAAVQEQQRRHLSGESAGMQLPVDYPFWLLLLVAMYYRLAPGYIEAFCHGRRPLAGAQSGPGSGEVPQPVHEFDEFLDWVVPAAGEGSPAPSASALEELYLAVRQVAVQ
jgi:hypothetical protein